MTTSGNPTEIKSESSTSNHDDEEVGFSDSSAEAKKVRPVVHTENNDTGNKSNGLFTKIKDEPKEAFSPAPVPIQGGEDDVIRVSHVRKIKLHTMEMTSPELPREEKKRPARGDSTATRRTELSDDDGSDCEPMEIIEKSPYEPNSNAEKGIAMFTKMKYILKERSNGDDYRTVNQEATTIFGPTNAWCLVKANALIDKSGMVYSQEWCNGNIRGNQIGKIPNDLLLLCLVSKRFVKAGDLLLSGLTRDFEVSNIVEEAIEKWKIPGNYEKMLQVSKSYQFATKKRDCHKCAIFVARAYSCYKAMSMTEKLDSSLMSKIVTCLEMMEKHLPDPGASKKRKKSLEVAPVVADAVPSIVPSDPSDTPKRKRGRPRKKPVPTVSSKTSAGDDDSDSLLEDEDDMIPYNPPMRGKAKKSSNTNSGKANSAKSSNSSSRLDDEDNMVPHNPPARGKSKKSGSASTNKASSSKSSNSNAKSITSASKSTANGKSTSLSKLVSTFEEQYESMGKVYQDMGNTLKALKVKIEENRTATEEEIRNELLLEVQENLLKSFGKKAF